MRTAYRCRAYSGPEQAVQLGRTFGCVRLVWNKTLSARQDAYHQRGETTSYKATDEALTEWKRGQDLAFLGRGVLGAVAADPAAAAHRVRELLRRARPSPPVQVPQRAPVGPLDPLGVPHPRRRVVLGQTDPALASGLVLARDRPGRSEPDHGVRLP